MIRHGALRRFERVVFYVGRAPGDREEPYLLFADGPRRAAADR